jgi:hypothetical protein
VGAGCIIEETETYKPAEAVLEALHIEIAVTASWMCGGWKEPCAEAVLAPLQDAELFIPVRVRQLNELWRNSQEKCQRLLSAHDSLRSMQQGQFCVTHLVCMSATEVKTG